MDYREKLLQSGFSKNTSYELFMLAVSVLSLVNLCLILFGSEGEVARVIFIIDRLTGVLFLIDFLRRLTKAESKKNYFFHQFGWADMIAGIPLTGFNIFRVFRIFRLVRAIRILGLGGIRNVARQQPADVALYSVMFLIIMVLEFGSIGILGAEQNAVGANIKTASDALWWAFVSITTVGYGDRFPVTDGGRLIGVVTLTVGVGLFGVVTGYLANIFLGKGRRKDS